MILFGKPTQTEPSVYEEDDVLIEESNICSLVVYNDEVNTFDFVIITLIEVCGHTPEQAEQCTLIIHFKGKCEVKRGSYDLMAAMCNDILRRGITAKVLF
jgi:ATP-dependent Clp protease adaptor protein ClpS